MDKLNFVQIGGFPLKAERLEEMQTAYELLNALGELAGNKGIIRGCVQTGTTVSDGVIYLNGEVFRFVGGNVQTTIRILQTPKVRAFQNGEQKEVHVERYATFASGVGSIPWADFTRPNTTIALTASITDLVTRVIEIEKKNAVFQANGAMVFWNKPANQIPSGWQEVVNWRGRVPVGFDSGQTEFNTLGKTGGAKSKALSVSEIPAHRHKFSDDTTGPTNPLRVNNDIHPVTTNPPNAKISGSSDGGGRIYNTSATGGGTSFSLMNPYRVVMFIEYIG